MKAVFGITLGALLAMQAAFAQDLQTKATGIEETYCPIKADPKACSSIYIGRLEVVGQPWLTEQLDLALHWDSDDERNRKQLQAELREETVTDEDGVFTAEIVRTARMLGQNDDFAAFELQYYYYAQGAAHGMPAARYAVFDLKQRRAVGLQDILVSPQAKTKLDALQQQAFQRYLQDEQDYSAQDRKDLEGIFPFAATDNWALDKDGLLFTFQPYEVGPYAMGFPQLYIPTDKLRGIVRPEYLKAAASWRAVKADKP
ncbi:MAG: RsiV family protein [Neisseria sp.]|nr:RsiV family protein [Neisseria sp.]